MEKAIKRFLERDEIPHHINEVKSDNRIENIRLMIRTEHDRLHNNLVKIGGNPNTEKNISKVTVERL
jgi:hypothetical protein